MIGVGCRVSGVGCRVSGVGCRVSGVGCRVSGVGCRVSGVGCRVKLRLLPNKIQTIFTSYNMLPMVGSHSIAEWRLGRIYDRLLEIESHLSLRGATRRGKPEGCQNLTCISLDWKMALRSVAMADKQDLIIGCHY